MLEGRRYLGYVVEPLDALSHRVLFVFGGVGEEFGDWEGNFERLEVLI